MKGALKSLFKVPSSGKMSGASSGSGTAAWEDFSTFSNAPPLATGSSPSGLEAEEPHPLTKEWAERIGNRNVRAAFLEESIDEGTQWVVFEPNDRVLWANVVRSISGFLTSVWRSGALMGTTAEEAFFVRCDRTTMTEDDIQNGRLICFIGVAPVRPAEFVIFRFSQKTLEAQA